MRLASSVAAHGDELCCANSWQNSCYMSTIEQVFSPKPKQRKLCANVCWFAAYSYYVPGDQDSFTAAYARTHISSSTPISSSGSMSHSQSTKQKAPRLEPRPLPTVAYHELFPKPFSLFTSGVSINWVYAPGPKIFRRSPEPVRIMPHSAVRGRGWLHLCPAPLRRYAYGISGVSLLAPCCLRLRCHTTSRPRIRYSLEKYLGSILGRESPAHRSRCAALCSERRFNLADTQ